MPDLPQSFEGMLDSALTHANSTALLNDGASSFLQSALAGIGESLQCGFAIIFELQGHSWRAPMLWRNAQLEGWEADPRPGLEQSPSLFEALSHNEPLSVDDSTILPDGPVGRALQALGYKALLCVPLIYEDRLLGGICLIEPDKSRQWTATDAGVCKLLGQLLGLTLGHCRTFTRLCHKHDQLRDILDAFVDPVYIIDMDSYELLFLNKSVAATFPEPPGPQANICYRRLQGRDSPCPFCTNAIIVNTTEPYQWTYENALTKRTYTVTDKIILWDDSKPVRLSIATDVTDLLRTQHEKQAAIIASQAKSEFLAHMSHEIRTPMNGIIGLTHLALQGEPGNEQKDYLHKIRSSATNLLAIINDILDLSKIEANKMVLENVNYAMDDVLDFVYTSIRFPLEQKGLEYICTVAEEVPLELWGDGLRLKQVLLNLLGNAVKFTSKGSISLIISREDGDGEDLLHVTVKDTGIGISREYQQHLFDPYTQANSSISRRFGGTGLGLTICKRIAGLMHGSLWCESEVQKGTSFHLCIPCMLPRKVDIPDSEEGSDVIPSIPVSARVLLVEDNEINQEIALAMLGQLGLTCDLAQNGQEAVAMALANDYSMVLMDVHMPVMDGLEATRQIRHKMSLLTPDKSLPIVSMTAATLPDNIDEILDAGMDDHIAKPFDADILRKKIAYWLNRY